MVSTEKRCILFVDDNAFTRELVSMRLGVKGYRVVLASDGEEAFSAALKENPDIVVCDILMPNVDGLAFCRKLRSAKVTTPFIFLSSKGQSHNIIEGLEAGADDYLLKPFDPNELEIRIGTVLRRTSTKKSAA